MFRRLLVLLWIALFLTPAFSQQVFVEPWQSLIRNTVSVNAGQAVQYNFSLVSGTILSAEFQVQGGVNDKIQVFLMDEDNYQLFSAHRPFKPFPGTSGTVRGIGKYNFKIPQDGVYYVVLDNGQAWLLPRNVALHLDAILPEGTATSEQLQKALQAMYSQLKQVFVFPDFQTSVRHCGVVNAFSNPNITLCAELVEELQSKGMMNAFVFVYLHELGHSLMREWGLPLWDNEDAADEFATAFLLMGNQKKIALDSAQWWQSEGATTQDAVARIWMDDRHSLSPQRARNIIRWVNDANDIKQRWEHVLVPHMQTAVLQSSLNDPAVPDKDFVRSELSRRNVVLPINVSSGPTPQTNNGTATPPEQPTPVVGTVKPTWPKKAGVFIATSSEAIPPFPRSLSGYRSENNTDFWNKPFTLRGSLRLFGKDEREGIPHFPNTMNGCSAGVFMVRWRSADPSVAVQSSVRYSSTVPSGTTRTGVFGYMSGSNCEQPMFKVEVAGSHMVDVYYELKFWQAAP
jgi:hypothetical protein